MNKIDKHLKAKSTGLEAKKMLEGLQKQLESKINAKKEMNQPALRANLPSQQETEELSRLIRKLNLI